MNTLRRLFKLTCLTRLRSQIVCAVILVAHLCASICVAQPQRGFSFRPSPPAFRPSFGGGGGFSRPQYQPAMSQYSSPRINQAAFQPTQSYTAPAQPVYRPQQQPVYRPPQQPIYRPQQTVTISSGWGSSQPVQQFQKSQFTRPIVANNYRPAPNKTVQSFSQTAITNSNSQNGISKPNQAMTGQFPVARPNSSKNLVGTTAKTKTQVSSFSYKNNLQNNLPLKGLTTNGNPRQNASNHQTQQSTSSTANRTKSKGGTSKSSTQATKPGTTLVNSLPVKDKASANKNSAASTSASHPGDRQKKSSAASSLPSSHLPKGQSHQLTTVPKRPNALKSSAAGTSSSGKASSAKNTTQSSQRNGQLVNALDHKKAATSNGNRTKPVKHPQNDVVTTAAAKSTGKANSNSKSAAQSGKNAKTTSNSSDKTSQMDGNSTRKNQPLTGKTKDQPSGKKASSSQKDEPALGNVDPSTISTEKINGGSQNQTSINTTKKKKKDPNELGTVDPSTLPTDNFAGMTPELLGKMKPSLLSDPMQRQKNLADAKYELAKEQYDAARLNGTSEQKLAAYSNMTNANADRIKQSQAWSQSKIQRNSDSLERTNAQFQEKALKAEKDRVALNKLLQADADANSGPELGSFSNGSELQTRLVRTSEPPEILKARKKYDDDVRELQRLQADAARYDANIRTNSQSSSRETNQYVNARIKAQAAQNSQQVYSIAIAQGKSPQEAATAARNAYDASEKLLYSNFQQQNQASGSGSVTILRSDVPNRPQQGSGSSLTAQRTNGTPLRSNSTNLSYAQTTKTGNRTTENSKAGTKGSRIKGKALDAGSDYSGSFGSQSQAGGTTDRVSAEEWVAMQQQGGSSNSGSSPSSSATGTTGSRNNTSFPSSGSDSGGSSWPTGGGISTGTIPPFNGGINPSSNRPYTNPKDVQKLTQKNSATISNIDKQLGGITGTTSFPAGTTYPPQKSTPSKSLGSYDPSPYLGGKSWTTPGSTQPQQPTGPQFPIPYSANPSKENGFYDLNHYQQPGTWIPDTPQWNPGAKNYGDVAFVGGSEPVYGRDDQGRPYLGSSYAGGVGMSVPAWGDDHASREMSKRFDEGATNTQQAVAQTKDWLVHTFTSDPTNSTVKNAPQGNDHEKLTSIQNQPKSNSSSNGANENGKPASPQQQKLVNALDFTQQKGSGNNTGTQSQKKSGPTADAKKPSTQIIGSNFEKAPDRDQMNRARETIAKEIKWQRSEGTLFTKLNGPRPTDEKQGALWDKERSQSIRNFDSARKWQERNPEDYSKFLKDNGPRPTDPYKAKEWTDKMNTRVRQKAFQDLDVRDNLAEGGIKA